MQWKKSNPETLVASRVIASSFTISHACFVDIYNRLAAAGFSFAEILNTILYLCIQAQGGYRSTEDRNKNLKLHPPVVTWLRHANPHHTTTTTSTASLPMALARRVIACCTLPGLHCVDTTGILATRQREEQKMKKFSVYIVVCTKQTNCCNLTDHFNSCLLRNGFNVLSLPLNFLSSSRKANLY